MLRHKIIRIHKYTIYIIITQVIILLTMAYMCPFPFMVGFAHPMVRMVQLQCLDEVHRQPPLVIRLSLTSGDPPTSDAAGCDSTL
jgi:hypothetical protein